MKVKAADVYTRAIAVLDEKGWIQGQYQTPQGCCLLGACIEATNTWVLCGIRLFESSPLYDPLQDATERLPHLWNDRTGRTVEDVKALLTRVAATVGDMEVEL